MQRLIVDRLEDGFAICMDMETDAQSDVPLGDLPQGVKDGDILVATDETGGAFIIDAAETEARRSRLRSRFDKLIKRRS